MTPEVSVVVATHGRAGRLGELLRALEEQTLDRERFEVVVVDDASPDETPAVLERALSAGTLPLTALRQPANRGPAAARNRGWRHAGAPLVAFTDDDCVPTRGWLDALLRAAQDDADAVIQGPTQPNPAERGSLSLFSKTVTIDGPSPHFETCNVAYPRALLERVGGFDEGYGAPAGEDSDLGWRVQDAGGTARFAPDAVVYHAVHERGPQEALREALLATPGVRMYQRNPGLRRYLWHGVFYDRSHPLLVLALAGLVLARRRPAGLALLLPYARHLLRTCRATGTPLRHVPWLVLYDAVRAGATLRGAVRYRTFVL